MQTAIIFDLEFTAWSGSMEHRWMRPGEHREVVQIGAIKLDTATLEEIDSFNVLVKPRLNPVLSPYLEALTGVTNEAVTRSGVDFADAYRAFVAFAAGAPLLPSAATTSCSWKTRSSTAFAACRRFRCTSTSCPG